MNPELQWECNRVVSALLNGGYQGLMVVALVWLGMKAAARSNAATRHAVWMTTLLLVVALPIFHYAMEHGQGVHEASLSSDNTDHAISGEQWIESPLVAKDATVENSVSDDLADPTNIGREMDSGERRWGWLQSFERNAAANVRDWFSQFRLEPAESQLSVPNWTSVAFMGIWFLLTSLRVAGLIWQLWLLSSFRSRASVAPLLLNARFSSLKAEMSVATDVALCVSEETSAPMLVGFRRPLVLIPSAMLEEATAAQSEQVLRHELAHLKRRDHWWNLLQQFLRTIFFFHPGVWFISRRLSIEREISCDDYVLAANGGPRDYALFLTEFAGRMQGRGLAAAPAGWCKKSQLKERIDMLLDSKRNASPRLVRTRMALFATTATLVALLGSQIAPRLSLAAEDSSEAKAAAAGSANSVAVLGDIPGAVAAVPATSAAPGSATVAPVAPAQPRPAVIVGPSGVTFASAGTIALPSPAEPEADGAPVSPAHNKKHRTTSDESVEHRLDRLEKRVEELLARNKATKPDFGHNFGYSAEASEQFSKVAKDQNKMAEKMAKAHAALSEEDIARITEQAERATERANREVERAARDAERAAKEAARVNNFYEKRPGKDSFKLERKTLEAQRSALQKQMHVIEEQLHRLEMEQQKFERQPDSPEQPKPTEKHRKQSETESGSAEPLPRK